MNALKQIESKTWISGLACKRCSAKRTSFPQALSEHKEAIERLISPGKQGKVASATATRFGLSRGLLGGLQYYQINESEPESETW